MKRWKKMLTNFVLIIPAAIGFYGFMQVKGMAVGWALYYTVRLYGFNTDISNINVFVEIARWLAPISAAGILIMTVSVIKENIRTAIRARKKDCCSVYGNTPEAYDFLANLGQGGIKGSMKKIRNTPYHVLIFDNDNNMMDFYVKYEQELIKHKVYLSMERNQLLNIKYKNMFVFSMADNCAIQYWKNQLAMGNEKIALIGDSELTDILLYRGLLTNITAVDQCIEYHIWKKDCYFQYRYSELDKIKLDTIYFHEGSYYQELPLLQQMDRVILCGHENDNIEALAGLCELLSKPVIHIKLRLKSGVEAIYGNDRVTVFGTSSELTTREIIIKEQLLNGAKELHEYYYKAYGGKTWEELDSFKKQANLFSSEYGSVVKKLYEKGVMKESLTELVHECWCRFHYLNGWKYAESRDDSRKLHNLLVPFDQLSENEIQKDRDIVERFILN